MRLGTLFWESRTFWSIKWDATLFYFLEQKVFLIQSIWCSEVEVAVGLGSLDRISDYLCGLGLGTAGTELICKMRGSRSLLTTAHHVLCLPFSMLSVKHYIFLSEVFGLYFFPSFLCYTLRLPSSSSVSSTGRFSCYV